MGKQWKQGLTLSFWAPKSLQMVIAAMKLKDSLDQPRHHIKKQRHYFVNKGPSSQGYGFSSGHVWMWELVYKESWVQEIDAFELWCWRRLLRVPWTAGRSSLSILKEISPGCWKDWCWSWNTNTLATSCEELTHLKRPWSWQRLRTGEVDDRGWDGWMAYSVDMGLGGLRELVIDREARLLQFMGSQRVGHDWVTELNWTDKKFKT